MSKLSTVDDNKLFTKMIEQIEDRVVNDKTMETSSKNRFLLFLATARYSKTVARQIKTVARQIKTVARQIVV